MRCMILGVAGLAALALAVPMRALADEDLGRREYESKCAVCHGATGEGNGYLAAYLTIRPPSLTRLKKANGGRFPFERITQVVDGRVDVRTHGTRDMPVWGSIYAGEVPGAYDTKSGQKRPDNAQVRARIDALVNYVSQLQE